MRGFLSFLIVLVILSSLPSIFSKSRAIETHHLGAEQEALRLERAYYLRNDVREAMQHGLALAALSATEPDPYKRSDFIYQQLLKIERRSDSVTVTLSCGPCSSQTPAIVLDSNGDPIPVHACSTMITTNSTTLKILPNGYSIVYCPLADSITAEIYDPVSNTTTNATLPVGWSVDYV